MKYRLMDERLSMDELKKRAQERELVDEVVSDDMPLSGTGAHGSNGCSGAPITSVEFDDCGDADGFDPVLISPPNSGYQRSAFMQRRKVFLHQWQEDDEHELPAYVMFILV